MRDPVTQPTTPRIAAIETLRGAAAFYVFVGHAVLGLVAPVGISALPFKFGGEAVMLFFLVSGFTVTFSVAQSQAMGFGGYFKRRFFRIYPIYLAALALGYLCTMEMGVGLPTLLGNLVMLQEYAQSKPGVLFDTYRNPALWSLSYEWWFYMMFWPVWRGIADRWQLPVVTLIGAIATILYNYVNFQPILFIAYFPIWWWGAEVAKSFVRDDAAPGIRVLGYGAVSVIVFGWFAAQNWVVHHNLDISHHPMLEFRQCAVAFAMIAAFTALGWKRFSTIGRFTLFSERLAPISYGIYALHFPLVILADKIGLIGWLALLAVLPAGLAVAWIAERKFQPLANRLAKRI